MKRLLLLIPLALSLIACGPTHKGTVTYQVHLKPSSVTGSTIADDIHVDPDETQWKTFLTQARTDLDAEPTSFEVTAMRMQLDVTKSKNVGTLQDVLSGEVTAFLRVSDTGAQVDIANVEDPTGSAQVEMETTDNSLEALNVSLARSDFRLGLRGSTSKTASGDFDAVITLTLDVTAR